MDNFGYVHIPWQYTDTIGYPKSLKYQLRDRLATQPVSYATVQLRNRSATRPVSYATGEFGVHVLDNDDSYSVAELEGISDTFKPIQHVKDKRGRMLDLSFSVQILDLNVTDVTTSSHSTLTQLVAGYTDFLRIALYLRDVNIDESWCRQIWFTGEHFAG